MRVFKKAFQHDFKEQEKGEFMAAHKKLMESLGRGYELVKIARGTPDANFRRTRRK